MSVRWQIQARGGREHSCAPWADPDSDPNPNPNPNLVLMYNALLCGCFPCNGACRAGGERAGASKVGRIGTGKRMQKHDSMLTV